MDDLEEMKQFKAEFAAVRERMEGFGFTFENEYDLSLSECVTFDYPVMFSSNLSNDPTPKKYLTKLTLRWDLFNVVLPTKNVITKKFIRKELVFKMIQQPPLIPGPNVIVYNSEEIITLVSTLITNAGLELDKYGLNTPENVVKLIMMSCTTQYMESGFTTVDNPKRFRMRTKKPLSEQIEFIKNNFSMLDVALVELSGLSIDEYNETRELPVEWRVNMWDKPLNSVVN